MCVSRGREGGLDAAQRQVNDGGKFLWLITPWKMPDFARDVTDRILARSGSEGSHWCWENVEKDK